MADIRTLTAPEDVDELIGESHQHPVWIFKHSLTCPTSAAAWSEYKEFVAGRPADGSATYALVEIQRQRPVSSFITEKTGVRHESPQALLLRDGQVAWSASHWKIRRAALEAA
jgi:bacillithiol system protein YtxJ